jgi:hypothetical protein
VLLQVESMEERVVHAGIRSTLQGQLRREEEHAERTQDLCTLYDIGQEDRGILLQEHHF